MIYQNFLSKTGNASTIPLLRMMNVKYLISPQKINHPDIGLVKSGSLLATQGNIPVEVYNLKGYQPRVWFVKDLQYLDDEKFAHAFAKEKGVKLYPVSFKTLLETLSEEVDNPRLRGLVRMYNVIGVSLSLGLIQMPSDSLVNSIDDIFSKKPKIAEINQQAASFSYNYASKNFENFNHSLTGTQKDSDTILVQGHYGCSICKMVSGCRFQSYYPIPTSSADSV